MLVVFMRRMMVIIPALILMSMIVFVLVKAIPGDPAQIMLGERATAEALATARAELGLDQPLAIQYGHFVSRLLQGDLGRSLISKQPISEILEEKFPATLELTIFAMLIATILGIGSGFIAAMRPGSSIDMGIMTTAVFGVSMPVFWLGLIFIWIFSLELGWFPVSGRLGIDFIDFEPKTGILFWDALVAGNWQLLGDVLAHVFLPALTLSTIPTAFLARMTRSAVLEIIGQDYIRTAKAKGLHPKIIYVKHALKNAFPPILTVLGLQFGLLLGGAIITETIFSWPGMGSWILDSVNSRDIPAIEAGILLIALLFMLVNFCVDLAYRFFDPRVRLS